VSGYRKVTKKLELTASGGATPTGRVWDAPCGAPIKDATIWLSSRNLITGVGDLDWEVIYGGVWDGEPFASDSTHSGGITQTNGTIAGGTELAHWIYKDASLFTTNLRSVRPSSSDTDLGLGGLPAVVFIRNKKKFAPITMWVTFVSYLQGEYT